MNNVDTPTQVLSLCSGVGQLDHGFRLAFPDVRTVGYVEIEAFPISVLVARMEEGYLDEAPIWTNLKTFDGRAWRGKVDCIIGGYPCQPFSLAGARKGTDDPRHLWPHIFHIITEINPRWCFFENVEGHLTLGYDEVKGCLEAIGYQVTEGIFSAEEVGAPHRRKRLFIMGHTQSTGLERGNRTRKSERLAEGCEELGNNNNCKELEGWGNVRSERSYQRFTWPPSPEDRLRWATVIENDPTVEPSILRVVDGMDTRLDTSIFAYRRERLAAIGNGVVPLTVGYAAKILWSRLVNP